MKTPIRIGWAVLAFSLAVHAQVNQTQLQSMKMWPGQSAKWLGSKIFKYAGDYGYYLDGTPMTSDYGASTDWWKWRFVYYTGLTGKRVIAYGTWGNPPIGPPALRSDGQWGDDCFHAHMSYGVWLQYGYYSGGQYYTGFISPRGGSKSGVRVNNNYCRHSVVNSLSSTDPIFGWGEEQFDYKVPKTGNIWVGMVVGATAVSHGYIGCASFACVNQPYIIAYTLNY